MSESHQRRIDIGDVIRDNTSEASLDDLQRKGFKRVKVLDKNAIDRLIQAVVDKVVSERLAESTEAEREELKVQARHEFNSKMSELQKSERQVRTQLEREVAGREAQISHLQSECQALRIRAEEAEKNGADAFVFEQREAQIAARELELEKRAAVLEQQQASRADEIGDLKETIQGLADSVRRASNGGGGAGNFSVADTSDDAIEALLSRADAAADAVENNLGSTSIKESQSSGVAANLAKLKSLNKKSGD